MRINDKHLAYFASSSAPADKEGYLHKRGEVNKAYQKRWFVLKGNILFYYDKKTDLREPIGAVILEGCTIELAENADPYTFEIVFPGSSSRVYVLAADTQEDMESWMKALACANYDYMKLMVSELNRQLEEINLNRQAAAAAELKKESAVTHENVMPSASRIQKDIMRQSPKSSPRLPRSNPFTASVPVDMGEDCGDISFIQMHSEIGEKIQQLCGKGKKAGALISF